jgi:hypothetical protein
LVPLAKVGGLLAQTLNRKLAVLVASSVHCAWTVTVAVEDILLAPLIVQFPCVGPMFTWTVGKAPPTDDTSLPLGVVKVAVAPPVVDNTLQLTVFSFLPVMLTLICLVDPANT